MKRSASESKTTKTQNIEVKQSYPATIIAKSIKFKEKSVVVRRVSDGSIAKIRNKDFLMAREYEDLVIVTYISREPQQVAYDTKHENASETISTYSRSDVKVYVNNLYLG